MQAVFVNVNRSAAKADSEQEIKAAAIGDWRISSLALDSRPEVLVAVLRGIVIGVWQLEGWTRQPSGRWRFMVSDALEFSSWLGRQSPVTWKQGQANPVQFGELAALEGGVAIKDTRAGNKRVEIDGWTLTVYPDGRARLHHTGDGQTERRLVVLSLFPRPGSGNITLTTVPAAG